MFLFSGQAKKRKREYEYESGSESGDEPVAHGDNNGQYWRLERFSLNTARALKLMFIL